LISNVRPTGSKISHAIATSAGIADAPPARLVALALTAAQIVGIIRTTRAPLSSCDSLVLIASAPAIEIAGLRTATLDMISFNADGKSYGFTPTISASEEVTTSAFEERGMTDS
jgi:hypothetical protein